MATRLDTKSVYGVESNELAPLVKGGLLTQQESDLIARIVTEVCEKRAQNPGKDRGHNNTMTSIVREIRRQSPNKMWPTIKVYNPNLQELYIYAQPTTIVCQVFLDKDVYSIYSTIGG